MSLSLAIIALTSWIVRGIKDGTFTWKNLMFHVFFQISLFMRQPIGHFNRINISVGLVSLIIFSLYETFITGNLIAPQPPAKFRNVGDLIEAGFIFFIDNICKYTYFEILATLESF